MGQTFVQRVLARHVGRPHLEVGDIVTVRPHWLYSHDNTAAILRIFREELAASRVRFPERLIVVLDHASPPPTPRHAQNHAVIRAFVREQGIERFFDVGMGIGHQLLSEADFLRPGDILLAADSHIVQQGWRGVLAVPVGRTEMAALWATGETWLRVPESLAVEVVGRLPAGVTARDAALTLVAALGADAARYAVVEFHGPGLATLTPDQRMTLANLATEMGAKSVYMPPDEVLGSGLGNPDPQARDRARDLHPDPDATYRARYRLHLDRVRPTVALPHRVDNGVPVEQAAGTPIDLAFIGTCAGGHLEDLAQAAEVLRGKRIHPRVRLLVIPASQRVLQQAMALGYLQTLVEAGAMIGVPGCGPCMGNHCGIPAAGERVLSTSNRNFRGRMGQPEAEIYLASARVVAASALAGHIVPEARLPEPPGPAVEVLQPPAGREPVTRPTPWPGREETQGRAWVYGDHISTDQIFPGRYTYTLHEPHELAAHALEELDPRFAREVRAGDVVFAGENFGHGSSREQAVTALVHAGVAAVVARSFARLFYRNAVHRGLPVLESPQAVAAARPGDPVRILWDRGLVELPAGRFPFRAPQGLARRILDAGGLVPYLRGRREEGMP